MYPFFNQSGTALLLLACYFCVSLSLSIRSESGHCFPLVFYAFVTVLRMGSEVLLVAWIGCTRGVSQCRCGLTLHCLDEITPDQINTDLGEMLAWDARIYLKLWRGAAVRSVEALRITASCDITHAAFGAHDSWP